MNEAPGHIQERPVVTVVTAVYNTGRYVVQGLDSLLAQDYPVDRIQHILVDDCSTDDSVQRIEAWLAAHPQHACTFIRHEKNQGLCKSLNDGLQIARGKYYSPMADDIWKPDRLSCMVTAFEQLEEDVAVLHTDYDLCDEEGRVYQENVITEKKKVSADPFINTLASGLDIHAVTTMHRTRVLQEMGGFDERLSFEDLDLYLRLYNKNYRVSKLSVPLTIYRKIQKNNNSLSQQPHYHYRFVDDFLKMNGSHYGYSRERDEINAAMYRDALTIYMLDRHNVHPKLGPNRYHTIWTPFLLRIYREKNMFGSYCRLLFNLWLRKKYSPYSLRDILYLGRKYFRKHEPYL